MSNAARALVQAGIAQGIRPEAIIAAAQECLARSPAQPTLVPSHGSDSAHPHGWLEANRVEEPNLAVKLSTTTAVAPAPPRISGLSRYDDLGLIGMGGMGEVRRVRDRRLGRQLAMKTLRVGALQHPSLMARFLEEAQATAQLQHPGIVPIHDLGELVDGRLWFSMKEVSGKTFGEVIAEVHAVSSTSWRAAPSGWTLRRLIDALRQVCEAVGYAHSRGVVHRDLKPDNIMVGMHGEVMVLDWGLAKVLGRPDLAAGMLDPVKTDRSRDSVHRTQLGQVAGTPAYMSPEQALGKVDQITARSDVYALGALLYEVLSGVSPYTGNSAHAVLNQVRSGPPALLRGAASPLDSFGFAFDLPSNIEGSRRPSLPPSLVAACERAMARSPEERFASAAELAQQLQAWLDGAKRRTEARAVVDRAKSKHREVNELLQQATVLRKEAAALLKEVEPWRPEEAKQPGWRKEDEAEALERRSELVGLEVESLLRGSLTHAPALPEAHAALAARYRAEHAVSESAREYAAGAEALLRKHAIALPEEHPDRLGHLKYLTGNGTLTLETRPSGAEVLLHRYVLENRRLVPCFERSLGTTPLRSVELSMGSYLCILKHPDRAEVRYPVSIGRGEHWHGVPPEDEAVFPIPLPAHGELGVDDCYVPAGWFQCGGDPHQERSLSSRRIWVDGRVFRRFPVTNRQYMVFLDSLAAEGRAQEAERLAPRERAGTVDEIGALIYGFNGQHFFLRPDADGDVWDLDHPVVMVDWHGARAFADWEAARTGQPWRLPGELAWEKAARGGDGRYYPWGDSFDPSWACMRGSHRGPMLPMKVGSFSVDVSPYGVRDMAGSMQDWCVDSYAVDGPTAQSARDRSRDAAAHLNASGTREGSKRVHRGGAWNDSASGLRASVRYGNVSYSRYPYLGFRLARSYP